MPPSLFFLHHQHRTTPWQEDQESILSVAGNRFLLSFFFIFLPPPPLALRPAPPELPLAFSFAFGADASAVVR
jgi:hypothetical protein